MNINVIATSKIMINLKFAAQKAILYRFVSTGNFSVF